MLVDEFGLFGLGLQLCTCQVANDHQKQRQRENVMEVKGAVRDAVAPRKEEKVDRAEAQQKLGERYAGDRAEATRGQHLLRSCHEVAAIDAGPPLVYEEKPKEEQTVADVVAVEDRGHSEGIDLWLNLRRLFRLSAIHLTHHHVILEPVLHEHVPSAYGFFTRGTESEFPYVH